jgi:hypothetical protein
MTNLEFPTAPPATGPVDLTSLPGDGARMAPYWRPAAGAEASPPVSPSRIRGVRVPVGSARLLEAMSDYGD